MSDSSESHSVKVGSGPGLLETDLDTATMEQTNCDKGDELDPKSESSCGSGESSGSASEPAKLNRGPPPPVPVKPPRVYALAKKGGRSPAGSSSHSSDKSHNQKKNEDDCDPSSSASGSYNSATSTSHKSAEAGELKKHPDTKPGKVPDVIVGESSGTDLSYESIHFTNDDDGEAAHPTKLGELNEGHSPESNNDKTATGEGSSSTFKMKNVEILISDVDNLEGEDQAQNSEHIHDPDHDNLIPLIINDIISPRARSKSPNHPVNLIVEEGNDETCITGCSWEMDDDDGTDCSTSSSCSGMAVGDSNQNHNNKTENPINTLTTPSMMRKTTVGCGMANTNNSSSSITTTCVDSHIKDQIVVVKLAAKVVQCPSTSPSSFSASPRPPPPPPPIPSYPDSSTAEDSSSASNPLERDMRKPSSCSYDEDDPGKDGNEPGVEESSTSELYQNMVVAHGLMIGGETDANLQVLVQKKVDRRHIDNGPNRSRSRSFLPIRQPAEGRGVDDLTEEEETEEEPCYQNIIVKKGKFSVATKKSNTQASCDPSVQSVSLLENGCSNNCRGFSTRIMEMDSLNSEKPVPVVHAVINLPPRKANLIKERRRSRFENMSYQKASRINQMMMAEFKAAGNDRPSSVSVVRDGKVMSVTSNNCSDLPNSDGTAAEPGSIIGKVKIGFGLNKAKSSLQKSKTAVTSQVERARKKMGSWYNRRMKTPVEQMGAESGLQGKSSGGSQAGESQTEINSIECGDSSGRRSRSMGRSLRSMTSTPADYLDLDEQGREEKGDEADGPAYSNVVYDRKSQLTDLRWEENRMENEFEKEESEEEDSFKTKGQNEFEELRRVVKQGGDFCKDLASVLQERSELEAQYAKGLSKLSAKLLKASKEATGSVAHAWQAVAVQIDTQGELHRQWSTALSDEVARPLRSSLETQHKIRKSVEVLVEKTTRNLAEWRTAESKAKRQCFSSSKEFEKLQESSAVIVNNNMNTANSTGGSNANSGSGGGTNGSPYANSNLGGSNLALAEVRTRSRLLSVPPMDKDPIKQEAKRRKAEEAVRRADIEYYTFCVRSERARLEWESAIRNGSTCLRTLEEEKLSLLRDLAVKYYQFLNELAPRQVQSVESLEDPVKKISVGQDMHAIVDIRRHAGAEQLLPDFYAEDTSNLMKRERRQEALQKFLYLVNQDLEREKKGAIGIETLAKAIAEAPKIDNAHHDISDRLYYVKSMLLYLEGTRCKVDNALADIEGRQRINNPITQYMRHQRDKQGFPQTILKVPSWAKDECLAICAGGGSAGSSSPDWNDRGNGDGTSGQHETDFDEFSSQDSGCDHNTDSCGEESNKAASNLISAPSIGRCRAIYDYDANLFDELTIRTGDVINIHDKQEDGWWLGELNGIIGIFPATYVEEISVAESTTSGD